MARPVADSPARAATARLLGRFDPPPFIVHNGAGTSPFLLIADHAGQQVPQALAQLGLPQTELDRHIGWDIGIAGVTTELARLLDAWAITQTYSRLVIDCNRPLGSPTLIAPVSDGTPIAANAHLPAAARQQRIEEIHAPYHARITAELEHRLALGQPTILVAMHSFTPAMDGRERPWHAGVLYNRDARLAHALRDALAAEPGMVVGDNQPYAITDSSDYAIPVHAEGRGLVHVELEIRQDLITTPHGQREWAQRLARIFHELAPAFVAG